MGLIGRYIRTKLEDTPAFRDLAAEDHAVKTPVFAMFRNYCRQLIRPPAPCSSTPSGST